MSKIDAAAAARVSSCSWVSNGSKSRKTVANFLRPTTMIASAEIASSFFMAAIISSLERINSSSQAIDKMRLRTFELPSANNRLMDFSHDERGSPSIISRAKSC